MQNKEEVDFKLPKIVARGSKRVGRGPGSGKGRHTAGRGQKGQKTRRTIHILFEGYKTKKSLLRRIPQLKGKGRLKAGDKPVVVNFDALSRLPEGAKVDIETLIKYKLVNAREAIKHGVKILGKGKLSKKLDILLPISKKAATSITTESEKKKTK